MQCAEALLLQKLEELHCSNEELQQFATDVDASSERMKRSGAITLLA